MTPGTVTATTRQPVRRTMPFWSVVPLRWPVRVIILVFALTAIVVDAVSLATTTALVPPERALLSVLLSAAIGLFAWRPPLAAATTVATSILVLFVGGIGEQILAVIITVGLVVLTCSARFVVVYVSVIALWMTLAVSIRPGDLPLDGLVVSLAAGVVAGLIGFAFRAVDRRSRGLHLQLDRQQREQAEQLRAERSRIADELHDIVAHDITIVAMHASVLRVTDDPAARAESQSAIEAGARQALIDIRRILRIVESPSEPGEDALDERLFRNTVHAVAGDLTAAGFAVTVDISGPIDLSRTIETAMVRNLREAATNVLKHASSAQNVRIRCLGTRTSVELTVDDDALLGSRAPWAPVSGYGLARMRERIHLLGGEFSAGPSSSGWRLSITLPQR